MRCLFYISIAFIFLLFSCQEKTSRKEHYQVHGIDISHYQSFIDWNMVATQDVHFAFVKATEGEQFLDTLYCHNWEEMKRVGLKRGAYHFFRPTLDAKTQARNFLNAVEMEAGDLPPVLDVEVMDGVSKVELINGIRTWLFLVEINLGIKPIIYTNQQFFNQNIAGSFKDYPLWIARYSSWRKPKLAKNKDWDFWQYGNQGRLEGINGDVDFNVFQGDIFELEEMCLAPKMIISQNEKPLP